MKSLSVVLPAFNEEANIRAVVEDAYRTVPKIAPIFEIIVVNDGSKDRTGEICDRLVEELSNVRVVHHPQNRGYGAALKSGIKLARHDLIFFTDADGQFDFKEVAGLLEKTDSYDIVAGYRARRQDPPHRLLFAWGWNILVRLVLGVRIRDIDCAFKVFNRHVFDRVQIQSVGAMVNTEIFAQVSRFGMTVKEVPVSHFPRQHGESTGGNVAVILKAFRELIRIRRKVDKIAAVIRRLRRLQTRQQSCDKSILSAPSSVRKIFVRGPITSK
jgi:glycosyltransferase involved in cell wall biosynthesis